MAVANAASMPPPAATLRAVQRRPPGPLLLLLLLPCIAHARSAAPLLLRAAALMGLCVPERRLWQSCCACNRVWRCSVWRASTWRRENVLCSCSRRVSARRAIRLPLVTRHPMRLEHVVSHLRIGRIIPLQRLGRELACWLLRRPAVRRVPGRGAWLCRLQQGRGLAAWRSGNSGRPRWRRLRRRRAVWAAGARLLAACTLCAASQRCGRACSGIAASLLGCHCAGAVVAAPILCSLMGVCTGAAAAVGAGRRPLACLLCLLLLLPLPPLQGAACPA